MPSTDRMGYGDNKNTPDKKENNIEKKSTPETVDRYRDSPKKSVSKSEYERNNVCNW